MLAKQKGKILKDERKDYDIVSATLELTPFEKIQKDIDTIACVINNLQAQLNIITKLFDDLQKSQNVKKKRNRTKPASGFASPAVVSDEMCDFLYIPRGSTVPRTVITRMLAAYIRTHGLQDKQDGRRIIPNEALRSLLRVNIDDTLSFFNLQRYLKPHFTRPEN